MRLVLAWLQRVVVAAGLLSAAGATVVVLGVLSSALAQSPQQDPPAEIAPPATPIVSSTNVQFGLGINNQQVADSWNPVRMQLRDVAPSTLTIQIDQGTLRSGVVPLTATYEVRGGAGVSLFEELLYLPNFSTLSWRLATPDRVIASGSIAGREADARPLDLVLTSNPGAYRLPFLEAFGESARLVDVSAGALPLDPAAYAGVRSMIIDGSAAAPSLEAVAAAVIGGTVVALYGPLPASHNDLLLMLGADLQPERLGAGALLYVEGSRQLAVDAVQAAQVPNQQALMAALLARPLVTPPAPMVQSTIVMLAALFALALLLLLRFAGAPGLTAALALAALVGIVGWQMFRPLAPQLQAGASLGLAGSQLALVIGAEEVLTMPRATYTQPLRARPLLAQPYTVDANGTHIPLERWRSALIETAPTVLQAQLAFHNGQPFNQGPGWLHHVYIVGQGLLGNLPPASSDAMPAESTADEWIMPLAAQLPQGAVIARNDCQDGCITWVLMPDIQLVAELNTGADPVHQQQLNDPFRSAPPRSGDTQ